MVNEVPVDRANIEFLQEIMAGEFAELVDVFIQDAEKRINKIKQFIPQQQAIEVSSLAHGLKGSAMNLSAAHLVELCKQLEEQAKQENLSQAIQLITAIEQEYFNVKAFLQAL